MCAARKRSWNASNSKLGINEGETTKDNLFSLNCARCIGACALAPAIPSVTTFTQLSPDKIPRLCQKDLKSMFEELSLHILDIAMNSLAAGARTIQITIPSTPAGFADHSRPGRRPGMDDDTLERVLADLTTTKRSRKKDIGLGLALLRQTAEMCDGKFLVHSKAGAGATSRLR